MVDVGLFWCVVFVLWFGLTRPAHAMTAPSGQLELISPRGGERWCAGSKHHVLWKETAKFTDPTTRIEYTANGCAN